MRICQENLGSPAFRNDHGVRAAYVLGGMVKAISSVQLVRSAARAGYLAFFGAGGMKLDVVQEAVQTLADELGHDAPWGVNFLHNPLIPAQEDALVDILLAGGVRRIEASAFVQITPALVRYRLTGLGVDGVGGVQPWQRILAKVSHPDIGRLFMSPPPAELVSALRHSGRLTAAEAAAAAKIPLADDVCVEADSGGHTDRRPSFALIPAFVRLRDETAKHYPDLPKVRIGAAGGIGSPEAVAAALMLGADFVMTGSINQCTPEAGTSDAVKDMLAAAEPQDFDMAPAGDLFEIGAKVQVLKRGTLFAARANRLYDIYRTHAALEDVPPAVLSELETRVFGRTVADVWRETETYYRQAAPSELERLSAKQRMAMIFRWYFIHSQRLAQQGIVGQRANFQIHCGPAMAACNRWLAGSALEDWRFRHVDVLADRLLAEAAQVLNQRYADFGLR